ncbi:hypothetical protein [Sulfuriferula thiophila]|uniref:hypothetical protein n=1 Tax=Sulfuriferula thiophila TaxID=1781211 RepID=UPI000F6121DA|nr:hypothetical protein [Sulfuriferula thiophila]
MNKIKITVAVTTIFLGFSGLSHGADTTTEKTPLSQSTISVDKNLIRDSDSKGLTNASTRLETNQDRIEAQQTVRSAKRLDKAKRTDKTAYKAELKAEKAARADKVVHIDKAVRVEKAERIEKTERPDKVERPEKIERPERSAPGR